MISHLFVLQCIAPCTNHCCFHYYFYFKSLHLGLGKQVRRSYIDTWEHLPPVAVCETVRTPADLGSLSHKNNCGSNCQRWQVNGQVLKLQTVAGQRTVFGVASTFFTFWQRTADPGRSTDSFRSRKKSGYLKL